MPVPKWHLSNSSDVFCSNQQSKRHNHFQDVRVTNPRELEDFHYNLSHGFNSIVEFFPTQKTKNASEFR